MLTIEMLPAAHGDALWLEYSHARGSRKSTIVIDGGPAHTYEDGLRRRVQDATQGRTLEIDLFIVSHIDADHIDGALILLQERGALQVDIKKLWFNGWPQLEAFETAAATYAPLQGEFLGGLITKDPALEAIWNQQAIMVSKPSASLPEFELPGGAKLTLLGPRPQELKRLRSRWASAIRDFAPGDVDEAIRRLHQRREYKPPPAPPVFSGQTPGDDRAPANGSSISFILEVGSIRVLLGADAHATTLAVTLRQFAADRGLHKVPFDCIKLPHHGSMSNVSADWLSLVDCEHWLISTNGAVFGHPDIETAQLIAEQSKRAPKFYCNYASDTTLGLAQAGGAAWGVVYPPGSDKDRNVAGIALNLVEGVGSAPASVKVAMGSPRPAPAAAPVPAPPAAPRRLRTRR